PAVARAQQSAEALLAYAFRAHGGDAMIAVTTIVVHGRSTAAGEKNAQPVVISASLDGKVRLDYGQPVVFTDVSRPEGGFAVTGGKTTWRAAHARAYAQLDWFSMLGLQPLVNGV